MLTPLVIAMPQPMAEALGWPDEPIGFADIAALANDPAGWGAVGHPEWGRSARQDQPELLDERPQLHDRRVLRGDRQDRRPHDRGSARPAAVEFATDIESSVVHYGDITMTFLNNWFAADARGTSLTYASAVAVEEKSVIDYNRGDPDGVLALARTAVRRVPLVAIYPEEGTLYSDNPFIILNTEWVDEDERAAAAELFEEFVQPPENQEQVLEFGFRPNNPDVALGAHRRRERRRSDQPQAELEVPARRARRHPRLVGRAAQGGQVLLVSTSPGRWAIAGDRRTTTTKLDLAKEAAISALDQFKDSDQVGLWVFSTDLGGEHPNWREVVPIGPIGRTATIWPSRSSAQIPTVRHAAVRGHPGRRLRDDARAVRPAMINAIVLLTDGVNDDGSPQRRRRAVHRADRDAARRAARATSTAGAGVHDLLRRGSRCDHAAGDQPGDQRPPTTPATRRPSSKSSPP